MQTKPLSFRWFQSFSQGIARLISLILFFLSFVFRLNCCDFFFLFISVFPCVCDKFLCVYFSSSIWVFSFFIRRFLPVDFALMRSSGCFNGRFYLLTIYTVASSSFFCFVFLVVQHLLLAHAPNKYCFNDFWIVKVCGISMKYDFYKDICLVWPKMVLRNANRDGKYLLRYKFIDQEWKFFLHRKNYSFK